MARKNPWVRSGVRPSSAALEKYFGQQGYWGHVKPNRVVTTLPFALGPTGTPLASKYDFQ